MAVTCGTPTPATIRVVQIEPGPTPTLTASAPASTSACAPARVATLPPMTCTCRVAGSVLSRATMSSSSRTWPWAVSAHEDVDAGLDQGRRALPGVAEVADRGADQQPAVGVLGGVRELLGLHEVLDGDQAGQPALVVDQRQLLALVLARAAPSRRRDVMPTGPVTSGIGVITSSTWSWPTRPPARTAGRGW